MRVRLSHPALLSWMVSRVAVFGALGLARFLVSDLGAESPTGRPPSGLLGWDATWYLRIINSGYAHLPWEARRFFPLLPGLAKLLSPLVGARVGVLIVVNAAALLAGFLLERLARFEAHDGALASRAAWFLAIAPPAFVLVMGYAEALMLAASIGGFLAMRQRRWGWSVVAGVLVGLSRPLGLLFTVPAAIEGLRGIRSVSRREQLARAATVAAPAAGAGSYLMWVGLRFGDPLFPFKVQEEIGRRGELVNPVSRLIDAGRELASGSAFGSGLHLPWALLFLALLVVLVRRWPASYAAFAGSILVIALSAANLDSLERYGLSAFPFVLAVAGLTAAGWAERAAIAISTSGLVAYATLAFLGAYVP